MPTKVQRYPAESNSFAGESATISSTGIKADPFWRHSTDLSSARWEAVLIPKIVQLTELLDGWDGYSGRPIGYETCMFAIVVLNNVLRPTTPCPQVVPTSSGALQLEWHDHGIDLEVKISGPYKCEMFFEDGHHPGEPPIETALGADLSPLIKCVDELASR